MTTLSGWFATITLGLLSGLVYLLIAIGLILAYRANRVINFALVEAGILGAAFLALASQAWHLPYPLAFSVAVLVGGAATWVVQAAIVHRLSRAPRVISVIATVGFAQVFLLVAVIVTPSGAGGTRYPVPDFLPSIPVGGLTLSPAFTALLIVAPLLVIATSLVLQRTRLGIGMRAAAANATASRLAGIPVSRLTGVAWIAGGMLSTVAVALLLPTRGASAGMGLGPSVLVGALTVAVIARLRSIRVAVLASIALGVIEAVLAANLTEPGITDVVLLVVLVGSLLLQRDASGRVSEREPWSAITGFPRLSTPAHRRVRRAVWGTLAVVLAGCLMLGLVISNADAARLSRVLAVGVIGLGVLVVTGLAGQLSLGQMSIAGLAGMASAFAAQASGQVGVGFATAAAVGAAVCVLVGLPALRLRGQFLAATTLALAVVTSGYLLPRFLGSGVEAGQPTIAGVALDSGRRYLVVAVAVTGLALVITEFVRSGPLGRSLRAIRDNEDAARAMGVPAVRTKLTGFAVAGALAGMGGAVLAHAQGIVVAGLFPLQGNTDVLASAAIGGLDTLVGPIIGALYVVGIPLFVPLDAAGLAATAVGWLLLLLYLPRGLPGLIGPLRARIAREAVGSSEAAPTTIGLRSGWTDLTASDPGELTVRSLMKSYGGVQAVDGVTITVTPGSIVGLIGANGAGKTTLFELIAGTVVPDAGSVALDGVDITKSTPERRLARGLVRSFQDAALFASMTTMECLQIACARTPGVRRGPSAANSRAAGFIDDFGLGHYRSHRVGELSTGTRRIVELACCAALRPRILLLDEPAAGIAQAEVEALEGVLRSLVSTLGCTLVVIEHDVALVRRLAQRVLAMHEGRIIADGSAEDVFDHPLVLAAYLGDSAATLDRSGSVRHG